MTPESRRRDWPVPVLDLLALEVVAESRFDQASFSPSAHCGLKLT
jgi:hypothetical protein